MSFSEKKKKNRTRTYTTFDISSSSISMCLSSLSTWKISNIYACVAVFLMLHQLALLIHFLFSNSQFDFYFLCWCPTYYTTTSLSSLVFIMVKHNILLHYQTPILVFHFFPHSHKDHNSHCIHAFFLLLLCNKTTLHISFSLFSCLNSFLQITSVCVH